MNDGDKYREWRKGEPNKLGWQDRTDPGPNSQESPREGEDIRARIMRDMMQDPRLQKPGGFIEVPDGVLIQQYDNDPPKWYEIGTWFYGLLIAVGMISFAALVIWAATIDKARALEKASLKRQQESTATTLDLCAVRLPMMAGRMVKTEGEVLYWHRGEDGGLDIYLTREIADLQEMCSMPVHLPPTVTETTWIPQGGERVAVCGLMVRSNNGARMNPGWRCL